MFVIPRDFVGDRFLHSRLLCLQQHNPTRQTFVIRRDFPGDRSLPPHRYRLF